jgi:hydrogenase nickel incorporation protein HypB
MIDRLPLETKVLRENDRIAAQLRERFHREGILCLNLVSSPGAGKTSLLERTLAELPAEAPVAVLTGDLQTDNDARRLARCGFPVRQITTSGVCHLDGRMIEAALTGWPDRPVTLLFIENVGNLVCPASYDLGEAAKVVVLSTAEGEDKPLKYPSMFHKASALVLNKIDLLPHVPFRLEEARHNALRINPNLEVFEVSCITGEGIPAWLAWLRLRCPSVGPLTPAGPRP